jgi:IS5 family transposase
MSSVAAAMHLEIDIADYTTLCRRAKRLGVSLEPSASEQARHIVIDSTGVKVYGEGEWKVRQHGVSKRRTWRKVHLGVDVATQEIIAVEMTSNDVGDCEVLPALLEQIDGEIAAVGADGAYDTAEDYAAIQKRGARSVIPPRHGAKIWQHGNQKGLPHPRDENLRHIRRHGRTHWKKESGYHQRSLAETAMYRFKTIFSDKLSARLFESQCVEVFIKSRAMNIMTRLGRPVSYAITP